MLTVDHLSRFLNNETIMFNGQENFGRWTRPDVLNPDNITENDIQLYKVTNDVHGRPDKIALEVYGTQYLEWLIVMFNRPMNPLGWPASGSVIKLLKPTFVTRLL